jgi:tetratricopeptide (TPR) repeat protein
MKCSKAKKFISEYIDGDLDSRKASTLKEHLEACPDCQKLLKDFQKITDQAEGLEQKSPSGHVWFRIQARLREEKQKEKVPEWGGRERILLFPAKLRYAVSAAFLLLVVVSAVIIGLRFGNRARFLSGPNGEKYALAKLEEAEHHYQLAIKALWEAVQVQKVNFDPKVAKIFRTNLEVIDASIADCRKAMESDPNDLESRYYLLAMYKKKADFLDNIIEAASTSSQKKESNNVI